MVVADSNRHAAVTTLTLTLTLKPNFHYICTNCYAFRDQK